MSTVVYPNPIAHTYERKVGEVYFVRTDPKNKKLEPGDFLNLHLENEQAPYGRAVVLEYVGGYTYRVRRTE